MFVNLPLATMKILNALFVIALLASSPTASAATTCKTCGTVAGVAGGAYVGHQTERSMKSATRYRVDVRMDSGKRRTFTYSSAPGYRVGDFAS